MLLHITTSPTCYAALQAAIDEGVKNGKISSPVTDTEAKAIPYLQAAIKEGLRKFPVIAGLLPKTVPEGGDIINGFSIPAGTDVSLSLISITHSKATFRPDAHIFRPERWLECDDTDKLRKMTLAADLVFGSGKWSCSGKNIAMMEMGKVLVEVSFSCSRESNKLTSESCLEDSIYPWRIRPSRGSRSVLGHIYSPICSFGSRREHIDSDAGYLADTSSRSKISIQGVVANLTNFTREQSYINIDRFISSEKSRYVYSPLNNNRGSCCSTCLRL